MNASRLALLIASLALVGCGRQVASGPPELHLGRDECGHCGMIISDAKYASALITRDGRDIHLFDDLGCMLDFEVEHPAPADRYIHDYSTGAWAKGDAAGFLFTDDARVHTPMGSGFIAFTDRARAEAARADLKGEVMDYAGSAAARKAWKAQRAAKTGG